MADLGSPERPLRVAIVGSGPSGFYAAEALYKRPIKVKVDMFDRLPVPYGLVRYGVAPDHPKIKNVIKVYEKFVTDHPDFSFLGNVTVGKDISTSDMKRFYDAVIFATGAQTDKKLGISGEDLTGSHASTDFVGWYNGHPDFQDLRFDFSHEVAVVVGQGNVAMDVCRILLKTVDELKVTDIAQNALDALSSSKIKEVHCFGRRGPVQAAFTPVEIREFGELADCYTVINSEDMNINEASQKELTNPVRKKNFEILKELAKSSPEGKKKKFVLHFCKSPLEIQGQGRVERMVFEKNQLTGEPENQKVKGTGVKETVNCGLVFRSVGYQGVPIEGLPFQSKGGVIPNEHGRITDAGKVCSGFYASGWIKRGANGIIGTNKADSEETVSHLLEDMLQLVACTEPNTEAVINLLKSKKVRVVTFADWKKIDAAEIERGQKAGKPREKFVRVADMLSVL